jgi:tetratricopeptide (TPR) repeat protein/Mg-chelatase subunit ChlD
MGTGEPVRIGEFSLSVDLGDAGKQMEIATLADARVEQGGKLVTMRRSGYTPRAPFQLEAKLARKREPLTVARFNPGDGSADYVLARFQPDVDWASVKQSRADVVVVVDTSAAGDEGGRQLKVATAEAILRALSAEDRFALVSLDVKATVLHPKSGLAVASDREIERALEALADHASGGATDLAAFFDESLGRVHGTEQPAIVYVGDGLATSGELSGEQIIDRLRRALSMSRARLFTVGVGTDADFGLLGELGRVGGGESLRVDEGDQTTARALELAAAIKSPTLTDFEIDLGAGLDEVLSNANGKLSRGTEVTVLARTHHDLPKSVKVRGRLEGKSFEKSYSVKADNSLLNAFVPRLWAAEYVRRLLGTASGPDSERGRIVKLGTDYGLMTPYTSILTLESEYAYQQRGIQRRGGRLRGVRLGALEPREERRIGAPAELWAAPRVAFGCSRSEAPSGRAEASPAVVAAPVPASVPQQEATATPEAPPVTAAEESKPAADAPVPRPVSPGDLPEETATGSGNIGAAPKAGGGVRTKLPMMWNRDPGFGPGSSGSGLSAASPRGGGSKPAQRAPASGGRNMASGGRNVDSGERGRDAAKTPTSADEGGMHGALKKKERAPQPPKPLEPQAFLDLRVCSDAASRPLANRVLLWRKRLAAAKTAAELIERYDTARRACELNDWQAERLFLALTQQHLDRPAEAEALLARFADRPEVRKYIGKLILRRTVDQQLITAVERALYGGAVDWLEADLKLQTIGDPALRLATLREIAAGAPHDPNAEIRIVRLLLELGKKDEALALGRRLRDAGTITPQIARELGDVLAEAGLGEEAVRIYSEIVEFDPKNAASRRLLGDIFLRHRWYDPAYRQYRTLTDSVPADPLGWLRLAAAAAGAGRIDEALRLERRVASAEGTPGPSDPRRWARLWSAVRLGGLLIAPQGNAGSASSAEEREQRTRSIERELKELGLFSGPGRLTLLTWENLGADVVLVPRQGSEDVALGESTDAAPAALAASLLPQADVPRTAFVARLRSSLENRPTPLTVHTIDWDSKHFKVTRSERTIASRTSEVSL